ncbi:hypothetical protein [Caballeronia novacaledonica]|uniref:hypothetical protein n=1 Tax=Caballeronia novacaledonica TaxID=1544861 RepID=UPI0011B26C43|nr:hypothetical protein [Caballeronia novacaledonica]
MLSSKGLFCGFAALMVALGALHLFSGIADNMDFNRSIAFVIDRPAGFSSLFPAAGTDEAHRLFITFWHDKWVLKPHFVGRGGLVTLSTYKIYLFVQSLFVRALNGSSQEYSIIVGSLVSRAIYLGTFLALFVRARRSENLLATWVFMLMAGALVLCSEFSAYFNSFFEDQLAIIFLPLVALFIYRIEQGAPSAGAARWWVLGLATFIGAAKTSFFPLPLIVWPFLLPLFSGRIAGAKTACMIAVCVLVTLLPVFFGAFKGINQYHAVYAGALTVLTPQEAATIDHIGSKPVLHDCINVLAFDPAGSSCVARAHAGYFDVLRLALMKPEVLPRIVVTVFEYGRELRIGYLGTTMEHASNFMYLPVFSVWRNLFQHHANYWILASLAISTTLIVRLRRSGLSRRLALLKVSCFLAVFGFVGYATSLGDGLTDTTRHLIGANYSLSLSAVFFVPGVVALFYRRGDGQRDGGKRDSVEPAHGGVVSRDTTPWDA